MTITPEQRRSNQRDNQDYFSEKLSDLCRYIGFGLIAAAFSLLASGDKYSLSFKPWTDTVLVAVALVGCLVIFLDLSQLNNGWRAAKDAAENEDGDYINTDQGEKWASAREQFFEWKRYAAIFGSALLVATLLYNLPWSNEKHVDGTEDKMELIC